MFLPQASEAHGTQARVIAADELRSYGTRVVPSVLIIGVDQLVLPSTHHLPADKPRRTTASGRSSNHHH